jgi:hypothetical protein
MTFPLLIPLFFSSRSAQLLYALRLWKFRLGYIQRSWRSLCSIALPNRPYHRPRRLCQGPHERYRYDGFFLEYPPPCLAGGALPSFGCREETAPRGFGSTQLAIHLRRLPCLRACRSGLLCVRMLLSQAPQPQRRTSVRPQPISGDSRASAATADAHEAYQLWGAV